jgi:outer membrane protein TolC
MKKILSIMVCWLCCAMGATAQTYTLEQLKDSALHNNFAIRKARFDINAAQQQRREAFTKYFPNVSATGLWFNANKGMAETSINPSELMPQSLGQVLAQKLPQQVLADLANPINVSMLKNGTIGGVTAVQPVFAGGQIINGNRLAKVGENVSRLQLQLSENEVEKITEQYFWQLVSLQEKMKTVEAVEALLTDIAKDVDVALKAGVAMRNDLLQVQLRQNDVASQKLTLRNATSVIKLLLAQYCGLHASDTWNVEYASVDPTSTENCSLSPFHSSLPNLPEYQLLTQQVRATDLQHKMEVGKNLPSVGVGAGYNYHNLLDNDHTFGMIFATVSVPISEWWGGSHAIKRKKIEHEKAQAQLADNSELLMIRMQKAYNDVEEARQQLDIAQRSIEQAEENLRLNRNFYQAGTSKMSDLLEAQLLYQQARDKQTDAVANYHNKLLEYRQATGQ